MISEYARTTDSEDVGALLHAIFKYGDEHAEQTDRTVAGVGYARLLQLATEAAAFIAQHFDETEDPDGSLWFDQLSSTDDDSLAAALFKFTGTNVDDLVSAWMAQFVWVQFEHAGVQYQFNSDELAIWNDDLKSFEWIANHGLPVSGISAVATYINTHF